MQFAPKVDVAPKVGFLPQKSFHILIAFADYDLPAQFSEFVCAGRLVLLGRFVGLGWKSKAQGNLTY